MPSEALLQQRWRNTMDRRAALSFNFYLFMFIRFTMLIIIAVAVYVFSVKFINLSVQSEEVEAEIIAKAMLGRGVAYQDPVTGRLYPGIVDLLQLKSRNLDDMFYHENNRFISARVDIQAEDILHTAYLNRKFFDIWAPLAKSSVTGSGSATMVQKKFPVIIKDENRGRPGRMTVTVIMPNS